MKISNKKEVIFTMYGLLFLMALDLFLLFFSNKFASSINTYIYSITALIFGFCMWKIIILKIFSLEVTDHIFSIKYTHPLMKKKHPVLELPLEKIISIKTEKAILKHILLVSIKSRRGIKNFYYQIGNLPENKAKKLKEIANFIHTRNTESYQ